MNKHLNFQFLSGDVNWTEYGGKWISKELYGKDYNEDDFRYYIVMELINMDELIKTTEKRYRVILSICTPDVEYTELKSAFECCGYTEDFLDSYKGNKDHIKVDALTSYGACAAVWNAAGNNYKELMREAREQAYQISLDPSIFLDEVYNMIGNTGWDFMRGEIGFK